jgi:hypothetical protein
MSVSDFVQEGVFAASAGQTAIARARVLAWTHAIEIESARTAESAAEFRDDVDDVIAAVGEAKRGGREVHETVVTLAKQLSVRGVSPRARSVVFFLLILFFDDFLKVPGNVWEEVAIPLVQKRGAAFQQAPEEFLARRTIRTVTAYSLDLRSDRGQRSRRIATLTEGAIVFVYWEDRHWLHVRTVEQGRLLEGWVLRRYTAKVDDALGGSS